MTPANSRLVRSRSTSSIVRVTSTLTHSVTCGALNALATIACAVILRTPLTGTRVSRSPPASRREAGRSTGPGPPSAAAITSSRVTEPSGPEAVTPVRSTPRSRASLRTGGLASTRGPPASGSPLTPWAGAAGSASSTCGSCTGVGVVIIDVCTACCAVAAEGEAGLAPESLRGRRFADVVRGPYPTSTEVRPPGAGPPIIPGSTASSSLGVAISATSGAATWSGAATVPPGPPTSTVMIGVPTSTVLPSSTSSSPTTPANGLGSSTSDFAVSISTTTSLTLMVSPGLTFQDTISASVRPSPTSGSLNCLTSAIAGRAP